MKALQTVWNVLRQSAIDFGHDNAAEWAAAIAYYALLSTFPLLIAAVSISGMVADPQWAQEQVARFVNEVFPAGSGELLALTREVLDARGSLGILSILVLLWSGSRVFGGLMKALNIAFNTGEAYTFIRRTVLELSMLLSLGGFFVATIAAQLALTYLFEANPFLGGGWLLRLGAEVVFALMLGLTLFLTYKYVPRCGVESQAALAGSGLAVLLFMIARPLFGGYVARFANYANTYGSLALIVTYVVWVWFVSTLFIFSGEVASHYQAILLERRAPAAVERVHLRRSPTHKDLENVSLPPKEEEITGQK